jgi:hypothetical protein
MIPYFKQILVGQFAASLAMLNQCIESCPVELTIALPLRTVVCRFDWV